MKLLFQTTTPFMSKASLEYLNKIEEAKFLFENNESESWSQSAEDVEFNLMFFKHNIWNDYTNLKNQKKNVLLNALASTDVSDLLLFDQIKGIEGNSVRLEWALRVYAQFLDIEMKEDS